MTFYYHETDWIDFYHVAGLYELFNELVTKDTQSSRSFRSSPFELTVDIEKPRFKKSENIFSNPATLPLSHVNDFFSKNLDKISLFSRLFGKYSLAPYSVKTSKEIITTSLNRLSKQYNVESLPLVYTTQMISSGTLTVY